MTDYKILINRETYGKALSYLDRLKADHRAGAYLQETLQGKDILQISAPEFIEHLLNTKLPQIFAESAVFGDGTDWNQAELSILGDISIATPVTVYDNGRHYGPDLHETPFEATLLFTPGALLRNGRNLPPADLAEVTSNGEINPESYYRLYERRLRPALIYANSVAQEAGKMAFITVPGLGCGQFAGNFRGHLGSELKNTLLTFLDRHGSNFTNIKTVYYDPYQECENERAKIQGIDFLVRPLTQGNEAKPQLCRPQDYEEDGDDFAGCYLFSFVAWDHVSWPGNDFYAGSRATDDGVKAAATSAMAIMTGIEGTYDPVSTQYLPPVDYVNWREVISKNKLQIAVKQNLLVLP